MWRLSFEPQLLMSRVLKEKYFPQQELFQVKQKGNDSWLWKSWLGAKHIGERGLSWRIRDGRAINIWSDRWLPNDTGGKTVSTRPVNCPLSKVNKLMYTIRNDWNRQLVHQFFLPHETNLILQIPICQQGLQDQRIWNLERKGMFSVRSYRLACSLKKEPKFGAESSRTRNQQGKCEAGVANEGET